jgi:hypothetical protein
MRRSYWLLPVMLLPILGCVTTNFFSKMNPDYEGLKYQRLLIQFLDREPGYAQYGEKALKAQIELLYGKTIECYLSSEQFYGGIRSKAEINAEVRRFMLEKRIDGVVICAGVEQVKKQMNTVTNKYGTTYYNDDQKAGGYRMELLDVRLNKSIWYSTASSQGNGFWNSYQGMMKGFIERSVQDLKANDLLGVDPRPDFVPTQQPDKTKIAI